MKDLDTLLIQTSRTFALSIPELPEPTRREVTVAYLLFRIADTFEDATCWTAEERMAALRSFLPLLRPGGAAEAAPHARRWAEKPPVRHEGYVELLGEAPAVLEALARLRPSAQESIRRHVARTAEGMARYAGRPDPLVLLTLAELRDYCYVVAGIVGEMLTELFVLGSERLTDVAGELLGHAPYFGEGLQLVNILRDASGDASEGRRYVQDGAHRAEAFVIAREDLRRAETYVQCLEQAGAPDGVVAFTALPVMLAWQTLDRVETQGPGAKLSRPEVTRLVEEMHDALENGRSVLT